MQVPENQKKQLITLSLAGAVLLAGIVAGLLVVQNQQIIKNRAADVAPSCSTPKGTCTVPAAGADGYTPFIINVKEIAPDGSSKTIATSPQNAVDPNDPSKTAPVVFDANPLMKYVCEVAPVSITKDCQPVAVEMNAPVCMPPTNPGNPDSPKPPTDTPKPGNPDIIPGDPGTPNEKACACGADGGILDCSDRKTNYDSDKNPGEKGLIIIKPKYISPKTAMCFQCDKIIVSDGTQTVEEYDCGGFPVPDGDGSLLPTPTGIRLHVAKGADCRNYTIQVLAKGITTDTTTASQQPIACANCKGTVCCPACKEPVETDCGTFTSNGKEFTCDFDLTTGTGASCGAINKEMILKQKLANVNFRSIDYDDPYDKSSNKSHTYKNAGVYDVKMTCEYYDGTSSATPPRVCQKTITVGCGTVPEVSGPPDITTNDCPSITFPHVTNMCIYD